MAYIFKYIHTYLIVKFHKKCKKRNKRNKRKTLIHNTFLMAILRIYYGKKLRM